ncbi:hypothetical protein ACJX0J_037491, partial [Zea mays]
FEDKIESNTAPCHDGFTQYVAFVLTLGKFGSNFTHNLVQDMFFKLSTEISISELNQI